MYFPYETYIRDTSSQTAIAQARVFATHQAAEPKDREKQAMFYEVFTEET